MKISRFVFNPFGENTYVVYDEETLHAAVIDPGMYGEEELKAFDDFIGRKRLIVTDLIYTHLHIDHTLGHEHLMSRYPGLKAAAGMADAPLARERAGQATHFRLRVDAGPLDVEKPLKAGDRITLGSTTTLEVIEVPGHSPGSIALYAKGNPGVVFTGDALFPGSIGRTDLPGGDHSTLIRSITDRLLQLPDDTVVLPGHTGETTIGRERRTNPFLN